MNRTRLGVRSRVQVLIALGFGLLIAGIAVFGLGVVDFGQQPIVIGLGYLIGFVGFCVLMAAWLVAVE